MAKLNYIACAIIGQMVLNMEDNDTARAYHVQFSRSYFLTKIEKSMLKETY
jgi:hypothetical protein